MATAGEFLLGFYAKNTDTISSVKNTIDAQTDASKYLNAAIDGAKVLYFYLDTFAKINPAFGIGLNAAALGLALKEIDDKTTRGEAVTLSPVIGAVNAIGDLLGDFAIRQGVFTLQPEVVFAGLLTKGVTTSLGYVNLVFGDTVLIPAKTPLPAGSASPAPTIDPDTGVATSPEVLVTAFKPLDISDANGNLLLSINRSNSDGFGSFTFYGKDPITGKPVTVDLAVGQTQQGNPFVTAEINDTTNTKLGSFTQSQPINGGYEFVSADANDKPTQSTDKQIYDDGSTLGNTTYANGNSQSFTTNADGTLYQRSQTELLADGTSLSKTYNGSGSLISTTSRQVFDDGSTLDVITTANGVINRTKDIDGVVTDTRVESGSDNLIRDLSTATDFLSLVRAIQTGNPLPILASGLRLANALTNNTNTNLSGASSAAASILSLYSLDAALERGDTFGAITAGAQALSFGAQAYISFGGTSVIATDVSTFFNGSGATNALGLTDGVLPYLNLVNSIINGDPVGTVAGVLMLFPATAPLGIALSIANTIFSLFDDEEIPYVPPPYGTGRFAWNGVGADTSLKFETAGERGGDLAVSNVMTNVLATLNAVIERERQQNPGSPLGIIANRMPSVSYDGTGYSYRDIDPLTGAEKHPELRFDTSGRPYNATPGSPESYQSITEGIARSALARGAVAPLWEVQTAKLQNDAGDPKAGLTEEERAGRDGQLASPIAATTTVQAFRAVTLDLDGDGLETTTRAAGVAFDVDDSGYLKQTAWVKPDDGFLVLDRNLNDKFDSGKELFANGKVALGRRGLAGMAWTDSNYDGKLSPSDPVWAELKVWQDLNQNGVRDTGEAKTLTALGITELNYSLGTFTQVNATTGMTQVKQLSSPDLEADKDGTRVTLVPEGILVQASADGKLSLLVSRVDDRTVLEVNRDGITGFEDIETIVNSRDLLANDTLGGFAGSNLSVTSVSNFKHGTGYLDANGFVHFSPTANYSGTDAGFDYGVRAINGQIATATV